MIDDDEEVDEAWYKAIYEAFTLKDIDFVGGPYVPNWSAPAPDWLPSEYGGSLLGGWR